MSIIEEIRDIVGPDHIFTDRIECLCNSRDMSVHQGVPDAVIYPKTTEQVSAIMKLASRDKVPVTARGSGTSTTGAVLPVRGGLLMDLQEIFGCNVHVISEGSLGPRYKDRVLSEALTL